MLAYAFNDTCNINAYATLKSFMSDRITPEGAEYVSELGGHKAEYSDFVSPAGYLEFLEGSLEFSGKYIRPFRGMSAIMIKLIEKVNDLGGLIHVSDKVNSIDKNEDGTYDLVTSSHKVSATKVVVAIPPLALEKVEGETAQSLKEAPQFLSIQPIPAFKGAAAYSDENWEDAMGNDVKSFQNFISNSDCLGQSLLTGKQNYALF